MPPLLPGKVLIVDDDPDTRANLCDIFELDEQPVETASSVAELFARHDWHDFTAVILDRRLPDGSAEEVLPRLHQLAPDTAVLIVTGYSDLQGAISALRQGATDYILKPIDPHALRASLIRVADRRRLTLAKTQSEAAFAALVETAPGLIVILRRDRQIVYVNRLVEELTERSAASLIGGNAADLLLPEGRRLDDEMGRVLAGDPVHAVEGKIVCRDGSQRWVLWNARRLLDYQGGEAILAIGQDVTELKQSQERTLQAERLAAIGQMVAGLTHESGNALARSQMALELLAPHVVGNAEALTLLERIQKALDHLKQLYEDIRNYAAPLILEREFTRLDVIWRQAWSNLSGKRQGRDARLIENTGAYKGGMFDLFRMEQVFRNIFENALAACRDPVEVVIRCGEGNLDGKPARLVSVRDNGPGLSPEQRQRIFEPFYTTKPRGTGLGMAIVKRIVEAHGGKIEVGAEVGGAEVLLTLPCDQSGATSLDEHDAYNTDRVCARPAPET